MFAHLENHLQCCSITLCFHNIQWRAVPMFPHYFVMVCQIGLHFNSLFTSSSADRKFSCEWHHIYQIMCTNLLISTKQTLYSLYISLCLEMSKYLVLDSILEGNFSLTWVFDLECHYSRIRSSCCCDSSAGTVRPVNQNSSITFCWPHVLASGCH